MERILIPCCGYSGEIMLSECLPSGQTIKSTVYSRYLKKMKEQEAWVFPSHILKKKHLLHQDNVKSHVSKYTKNIFFNL